MPPVLFPYLLITWGLLTMGAIFALITGLCWASYNLSVRRGMAAMDSGVGYVVVLVFGSIANLLWLLFPLPGRGAPMTHWLAVLLFIVAGFSTTLLGRWVYFKSVKMLGPSRASAWKNASPLYTLLFGYLLLGEKPGVITLVGTAIILAGLLFLSREQSQSVTEVKASGQLTTAIFLGVASGAAFSAGMLLRKAGLNLWPDPAAGNVIGGLAAFAAYMPFAFAKGEVAQVAKAPWKGVSAFLWAGCFSALAQLFTFLSLREIPAASTQVITAMEPIFTIFLSALLLRKQEGLNIRLVSSAALVCTGVALISLY
ncbi:MAG TPA: DMT family transporter [Symbiobacteriaceae bacterium]|nr:DMT family transporter [Symbiobacteriaceae bacterium]